MRVESLYEWLNCVWVKEPKKNKAPSTFCQEMIQVVHQSSYHPWYYVEISDEIVARTVELMTGVATCNNILIIYWAVYIGSS